MMTETIVLTGEEAEFFAPVQTDLIDNLLAQYEAMRAKVERVADVMNGPDLAGSLHYFSEHAGRNERHLYSITVEKLFNLAGAIAHLNASYWSRAMHLTDVLDVMPQSRRDEWDAQIMNPLGEKKDRYSDEWKVQPIPEFNDENVRGTLMSLLAQRDTFFAERVDGVFRGLSKTHVTNAPEGFNRRMILSCVTDSYSYSNSKAGVINDLRCVIAKFMGREEPSWDATGKLVRYARSRRGDWIDVDGGSIRIRCYAVGTAHLEVHPDMAWRLNCVLAQLYPLAIPSKFRERPKKKAKEYKLIGRPLPFAVLSLLDSLEEARDLNPDRHQYRSNTYTKVPGCYEFRYGHNANEQVVAEARQVLQALGGASVESVLKNRFAFDYNPLDVVQEIVASGCIPDAKSHQFYPTPAALAERVVDLAEIGPEHSCLEPSAGMGGLADLMPKDRTVCVEISALHCKALEAKGHRVTQADFLALHTNRKLYDRVVMNPPFSDGRWQAHLQHAADMVSPGGRIVAILPSGAKRSTELPGFNCEWVGPLSNQFPGVSVDVVVLVANRKAE